jgi:hypothetical protein
MLPNVYLSVMIPAYNEEERLPKMLGRFSGVSTAGYDLVIAPRMFKRSPPQRQKR